MILSPRTPNREEPGAFSYVTVPGDLYGSTDAGGRWEAVPLRWPDGLSQRGVLAVVDAAA